MQEVAPGAVEKKAVAHCEQLAPLKAGVPWKAPAAHLTHVLSLARRKRPSRLLHSSPSLVQVSTFVPLVQVQVLVVVVVGAGAGVGGSRSVVIGMLAKATPPLTTFPFAAVVLGRIPFASLICAFVSVWICRSKQTGMISVASVSVDSHCVLSLTLIGYVLTCRGQSTAFRLRPSGTRDTCAASAIPSAVFFTPFGCPSYPFTDTCTFASSYRALSISTDMVNHSKRNQNNQIRFLVLKHHNIPACTLHATLYRVAKTIVLFITTTAPFAPPAARSSSMPSLPAPMAHRRYHYLSFPPGSYSSHCSASPSPPPQRVRRRWRRMRCAART